MDLQYRIISTKFGYVGFVMRGDALRRLVLPLDSAAEVREAVLREEPKATESRTLAPRVANQITQYFAGEPVEFDMPLDFAGRAPFETAAWKACAKVRYGRTASYRDLAKRIGNPAASRAVGAAMGRNPIPVVIPCHRILRSDGSLGGYSGSQGQAFKQRLLEMESASVTAK